MIFSSSSTKHSRCSRSRLFYNTNCKATTTLLLQEHVKGTISNCSLACEIILLFYFFPPSCVVVFPRKGDEYFARCRKRRDYYCKNILWPACSLNFPLLNLCMQFPITSNTTTLFACFSLGRIKQKLRFIFWENALIAVFIDKYFVVAFRPYVTSFVNKNDITKRRTRTPVLLHILCCERSWCIVFGTQQTIRGRPLLCYNY